MHMGLPMSQFYKKKSTASVLALQFEHLGRGHADTCNHPLDRTNPPGDHLGLSDTRALSDGNLTAVATNMRDFYKNPSPYVATQIPVRSVASAGVLAGWCGADAEWGALWGRSAFRLVACSRCRHYNAVHSTTGVTGPSEKFANLVPRNDVICWANRTTVHPTIPVRQSRSQKARERGCENYLLYSET